MKTKLFIASISLFALAYSLRSWAWQRTTRESCGRGCADYEFFKNVIDPTTTAIALVGLLLLTIAAVRYFVFSHQNSGVPTASDTSKKSPAIKPKFSTPRLYIYAFAMVAAHVAVVLFFKSRWNITACWNNGCDILYTIMSILFPITTAAFPVGGVLLIATTVRYFVLRRRRSQA